MDIFINVFVKGKDSKKIIYSVHSRMSPRCKISTIQLLLLQLYACISFRRRRSSNNKTIDQATKEHRKEINSKN